MINRPIILLHRRDTVSSIFKVPSLGSRHQGALSVLVWGRLKRKHGDFTALQDAGRPKAQWTHYGSGTSMGPAKEGPSEYLETSFWWTSVSSLNKAHIQATSAIDCHIRSYNWELKCLRGQNVQNTIKDSQTQSFWVYAQDVSMCVAWWQKSVFSAVRSRESRVQVQ